MRIRFPAWSIGSFVTFALAAAALPACDGSAEGASPDAGAVAPGPMFGDASSTGAGDGVATGGGEAPGGDVASPASDSTPDAGAGATVPACVGDAGPPVDTVLGCSGANTELPLSSVCVGGMTFGVRIAGPASGETVLLLHGFPEGSYEWRFQMETLVHAGYRVVAPDQRGYSRGARPGDTAAYTIPELVSDAIGLMDALGAQRFHVVGHDWGGAVAWGLALVVPGRVLTLTSLSVPAPGALGEALADTTSCQYGVAGYFSAFTGPDAEDGYLANDGLLLRFMYGQLPADAGCVYFGALDSKPALHAAFDWYRANTSGRTIVGTTSAHTNVPTMLVWGDQDPFFCRATVDLTAKYVDGPYRLEVLPGINHWVPEVAADRVSVLLIDHLASVRDR